MFMISRTAFLITAVAFSSLVYASDNPAQKNPVMILKTPNEQTSYAIGFDIGHNFKTQGIPLSTEAMNQGLKDGVSGVQPLMTAKEMQTTLLTLQKELMNKRQVEMSKLAEKNKTDGQNFLDANKKKDGVLTLPSGLQYKIIKAGEGESPKKTDSVQVNYEGSFPDGRVFDSSYVRGKPITFPVSSVIPGWIEALQMMKPGATWIIYVPSELAYGQKGAGSIGPNQVLTFKIELLSVQKQNADQIKK